MEPHMNQWTENNTLVNFNLFLYNTLKRSSKNLIKAVYEVGGANSIPTTFLYSNKIFTYKKYCIYS